MPATDAILTYPDPRLRRTAEPVEEVTPELRERVQAMFPLMYEAKGIGLAAPQIGWNKRLFVINVTGEKEDELALINPRILEKGGGTWLMEEGCLSLPGIHGKVRREKRIVVEAEDLDGNVLEIECDGLVARCILHEYDHLDGVLFIDRLSPAKKQSLKRKLRALEERAASAVR
ncbi:MAG: peptide deformylase [Planctomycetota bacterium]|nr:MAG: peptide deformylase [Planctomycetota bacterium]